MSLSVCDACNPAGNDASKDSALIDKVIEEQIAMGGAIVYAYRYLGTPAVQARDLVHLRTEPKLAEVVDIGSFLGIEDPLYLENRDREYDFNDIPRLNGVFKVSQDDMIYGRFGPQGMHNDVFAIEFHMNTVVEELGRRFIVGDVIELPHMQEISVAGKICPKLYEIARVMKSPTGWDPHYVEHILSVIVRPVRDQQEFIQFMERLNEYGNDLRSQVSPADNFAKLNADLNEKARALAPSGIWDTTNQWFNPKDESRRPDWRDDGKPPNGASCQSGTLFPARPLDYDYFLRTDMYPNRLFQFYNNHWNLKQIDKHLEWQPYAWATKWQTFLTLDPEH